MATTIKKPKITPPTRQQQQAANRPEYESQVPGLIDRVAAEANGWPGETMRAPAGAPAPTERAMNQRPLRLPVPTELKRKSKIKAKAKRGDVYVDGARVGAVAGLPRG